MTQSLPNRYSIFGGNAPESAETRDERLFRGIVAGDPAAFEEAFRAYYDELYRFAYRYVRTKETAEELAQDALLGVWKRRDTLVNGAGGRLRPLLFRATQNLAISWLRHERVEWKFATRERTGSVSMMSQYASDVADGEEIHAARELTETLKAAIAQLPPKAREAITLRVQRQLSNGEIAEVMGCSVKMVEFSIARAIDHLRRLVERP